MKQVIFTIVILMGACCMSVKGQQKNSYVDKKKKEVLAKPPKKNKFISFLEDLTTKHRDEFNHYRLSVRGGAGFLKPSIGDNLPDAYVQHKKAMTLGGMAGADFSFYLYSRLGIGAKYQFFTTNHQARMIQVPDQHGLNNLDEKLYIHFIGPYFFTRIPVMQKRNAWIFGVSLGHLTYKNIQQSTVKTSFQSHSLGVMLDMGYEVKINSSMALGLMCSYTYGNLGKTSVGKGTNILLKESENRIHSKLSRFDIGISFQYQQ